jgi:hypothetical protein
MIFFDRHGGHIEDVEADCTRDGGHGLEVEAEKSVEKAF